MPSRFEAKATSASWLSRNELAKMMFARNTGARQEIAEERVTQQQRFRWQQEIDNEHTEEQQVKWADAPNLESAVHQHGQQHTAQDSEEDQRVDQPGAAEQEREGDKALSTPVHYFLLHLHASVIGVRISANLGFQGSRSRTENGVRFKVCSSRGIPSV
jgi:hypothetical protein